MCCSTTSASQKTDTSNNIVRPKSSWSCRLSPPTIKAVDMLRTITLTICIVASITLPFFFAFSTHSSAAYKILSGAKQQTNPAHLDLTQRYNKQEQQHQSLVRPSSDDKVVENKTNLSHLFFGIGGTAKSWPDRRHYAEIWWTPKKSRGYVWLDEKPDYLWPYSTSPEYKISADTSNFKYSCWYGSRSAVRIARIVKESFELGLDDVRWFVMGDDDTVFFVENLIEVLRKYDHNQMYYVGGNSESVEQDVIHSYTMAYGGGGFAISYPLAKELVRILDGCIDRYDNFYGSDQKIQG